jgi:hypothetical protein
MRPRQEDNERSENWDEEGEQAPDSKLEGSQGTAGDIDDGEGVQYEEEDQEQQAEQVGGHPGMIVSFIEAEASALCVWIGNIFGSEWVREADYCII